MEKDFDEEVRILENEYRGIIGEPPVDEKHEKTDLEKQLEELDDDFSDLKFPWKKVLVGTAIALASTFIYNNVKHNGPGEKVYKNEVFNNSTSTGIVSYVTHRHLSFELNNKKYEIDWIFKNNMITGTVLYEDEDGDKKVDGISSRPNIGLVKDFDRDTHYDIHQEKFEKADEFFAKYIEELSE